MVDSDPTKPVMAKVGDFGLSSRMFVPYLRETMRHRLVENPTWLAPEITREEEFNEKSDIYAYGIILWELLTRKHPFEDWGFNFMFELEDAVKIEKKRPDLPSEAPEVLSKLVRTCWEDDPSVRPSFTEIMELLITLVKEKCPGKVAIPPTYYVGTRWESGTYYCNSSFGSETNPALEFVTEDVHRTLSTTHDSARRRVSRTNLQYNNTEDNDFGKT
jgi:serine/threonine protein kinase